MSSLCLLVPLNARRRPQGLVTLPLNYLATTHLYAWFDQGTTLLVVVNIYFIKEKHAGAVAEFKN